MDEEVRKRLDEFYIYYIRNLARSERWTTDQIMEKMEISPEDQARYAKLL